MSWFSIKAKLLAFSIYYGNENTVYLTLKPEDYVVKDNIVKIPEGKKLSVILDKTSHPEAIKAISNYTESISVSLTIDIESIQQEKFPTKFNKNNIINRVKGKNLLIEK